MSWAQRRKATYLGVVIILSTVILVVFLILFFSENATCDDGKKNQNEVGIDCGGVCVKLCRTEYANPKILWTKWSKVLNSGIYNVLIYGENSNINTGAYDVPYYFKIYDKNGVLLFEKYGNIYIPPNKNFAIFQDDIDIKDKIPARIDFNFNNNVVWQNIKSRELDITTQSKILSRENTEPRVDAVVKNKTLKPIRNIEFIVILYDIEDNAVAFSKTKVDLLVGEGSQDISFNWPEPFFKKIYKIELVPKVLSENL